MKPNKNGSDTSATFSDQQAQVSGLEQTDVSWSVVYSLRGNDNKWNIYHSQMVLSKCQIKR